MKRRSLAVATAVAALLALTLALFVVLKGRRNTSEVLLVFPTGFHGLAKVCRDLPTHPTSTNTTEVIYFGENGQATHGNAIVLFQWQRLRAQFSNATPIPVWDTHKRPLANESVGVWNSGTTQDQLCCYFFVGGSKDGSEATRSFLHAEYGAAGESLMPQQSR